MRLFEVIERRGQRDGPHLLITAAVHGDEYEGVEALRSLSRDMANTDIVGMLSLVPIVNESAYELGSRVGTDGLDLARTFPGNFSGTITERVADALTLLIQSADYYIDLHSGGRTMVVEPFVGYMLVDDHDVLDTQRKMARAFGLPTIWGTSKELEGRSLSVSRDAGIPAIYAEYLGAGTCSSEGVAAYCNGCRNVMNLIGMIPEPATSSMTSEWMVEDARPGSGHLQIGHPSHVAGTFETHVRLGQIVAPGAVIGYVTASNDHTHHPVLAAAGGRLICLRVDTEVEKGDGLAVILETDAGKAII